MQDWGNVKAWEEKDTQSISSEVKLFQEEEGLAFVYD